MKTSENERQKWDQYYASLPSLGESEGTAKFNEEFREAVSGLLRPGSSILEAGCGAGWQSLALARLGRYAINLMDFSQEALRYAQRLFEGENLQANFIYGDVFEPDKPNYDLVFNAGVLEHYTFDQQVAFLRGMASRSRRYVMVLVPNALCYWYWLWRIQKSGEGKWPYGKEVPIIDLSRVFKSAGLELLGQRFMGEEWAGGFVRSLTGLDERLRHHILEVHCSPVIPKSQKSYLVAALGSVTVEEEESPPGWEKISQVEENGVAEIRAALADALALMVNAEQKLRVLQSEGAKRTQQLEQKESAIQTLRAELAKEQRTLQAVRASLSFQLGSMLIQAIRNPGRNTVLLPYRVFNLGIKAVRRKPSPSTPRAVGKKAYVLEIIRGRIDEIKQEIGNAATGAIEPRRKDLKIAVIMDEIFHELFKYEANLITFTPDDWKQVLIADRPDFLLIDSAWHGNNDTWKYQIDNLRQKPGSKLPDLVQWCKTQGIPTAFWNREDPPHYEEFLDTARLFDYVFTTDSDCIERYKKDLGHNNIFCLTFAAQPRIHNPVGSARKIRDVGFAGSWYVRHGDRIKQMEYVLKPALKYDIDIFDRHYTMNDERYRFPEEYQPNILGELGYGEMVYAYKMYRVFLNVNSVPESPTMFAMRVPEILASGTCVLSGSSKGIENLMGSDIVKMSSSPEETRLYLQELLGNKELRDRLANLGLRKIMKEHTYEKRLDYILKTMGIAKGNNSAKERGVSIITCTNKFEYMDNIFANYDRQKYEDKELIVILNNDRLNLEEWREKAKSYPNVTVYQVDEKEPLGVCLNYGIEKAGFDYISKFDDDDYYAPAFLEDLMNAFEYTDADIVGKCASYIYFENGNTLALYGEDREHCYTHFVLGATIIIKREVFDRVPWPTDRRQGSDSEFLRQSVRSGFKIYSADRFNYVYMRRSSPELHTWKVKDEEQLANCRIICHTKDYVTHATC